ncbi:Ubiquitin carboxyl-terminal hydrolase [Gracilaria domingensis]|nr:Ubiquitin carboxyl-terminal hydrolase [Gracilaria domingensis]
MNQPALWRPPISTLADYLLQAASSKDNCGGLDPRPVLALLEKSGWKSRYAQDAHESMLRVLELVEDSISAFPREGRQRSTFRMGKSVQTPPLCIGRTELAMDWKRREVPPYISTTASWNHCFSCGYTSPISLTESPMILVPVTERSKPLASLVTNAMYSRTRVEMCCDGCGECCTHLHCSEVWRLPRALIILLQRASYGSRGVSITRSQVWFYKYINITRPYRQENRGEVCYALRSVVRHAGSASGYRSHYDCILRAPESSVKGIDCADSSSRWWHVDDDHITRSSVQSACDTSHLYLLMFEMET